MGLFGKRGRSGVCGVCGALMPALGCKRCDNHASTCRERFHAPGRCRIGARERDFPGTAWDHQFRPGDIPPAEFV